MKTITIIALAVFGMLAVVSVSAMAFLGVFTISGSTTQGAGGPTDSYDGAGDSGIPFGYENGDYYKGAADAPVTIIEYSDFQCPFCARFFTDTLPQIEENYIKTGKVKLIFRDFPLSFHANAQKASEAAEAAGEQGKYWEMHDKLFANSNALSVESEKQWAAEMGLSTAQFNEALDSGKYASEVAADMAAGQAAGVSGTPAFFINGKLVVGAQPYEVFAQAIDAALADAGVAS